MWLKTLSSVPYGGRAAFFSAIPKSLFAGPNGTPTANPTVARTKASRVSAEVMRYSLKWNCPDDQRPEWDF